ncbi:MAG: hypothetical protein LBU81_02980 [Methanosarcinales archaeon]|jgi:hypothetical protein|nr:hypothetical protein [Methanosarcinales archaeon]
MKKAAFVIPFILLLSAIAASGCISNTDSTENTFEPNNFLKTASLSED